MPKFHVRRGDEVVVISGSAKGRRGKITRVITDRKWVVLEGTDERSKEKEDRRRLIRPMLHHLRERQSPNLPQGGLLWLEGPIHISKVMKVAEFEARQARRANS